MTYSSTYDLFVGEHTLGAVVDGLASAGRRELAIYPQAITAMAGHRSRPEA